MDCIICGDKVCVCFIDMFSSMFFDPPFFSLSFSLSQYITLAPPHSSFCAPSHSPDFF